MPRSPSRSCTPHRVESRDDAIGQRPLDRGWRASSQGTLIERVRSEFADMPGMRLTVAQVQRLCGVEELVCTAVLDTLVESRVLCRNSDGTYTQLTHKCETQDATI
jgi:hypothetical protein